MTKVNLECTTKCSLCNVPCMLSNTRSKNCPVCKKTDFKLAPVENRDVYFCSHCRILYSLSHEHSSIDSYISLITEYEYDNVHKIGIPILESVDTLRVLLETRRFKMLKQTCFCNAIPSCEEVLSSCPNR